MVDLVLSSLRLLLALALVALNGFFVASEFALVRIRATSVERLAAEGRAGSSALELAVENLDDYLAATQLGITIASLGLGWVGEPAVAALIEPVLASLLPEGLIRVVAFALGFGFITFLHVVFGELAPKTIAIQQAERIALLIAPPMRLCYLLFAPGILLFNGTANAVTRLLGVPPASETDETMSEEEILLTLARARREGRVDRDELEMIRRVFALDDMTAREVMVPRPDVVTIPPDAVLDQIRATVLTHGHTRYPVLEGGGTETIRGFIDVKDVLAATEADEPTGITAGALAREMPIVPETIALDDLLVEFQRERRQMVAIIDEWGAFEGIVTVEAVVEEIVGQVYDVFDDVEETSAIDRRGDGSYAIRGNAPVSEVNAALGTSLGDDDATTIGGVVLARIGRGPEAGDRVELDGFLFEVAATDGTRISDLTVEAINRDA